MDAMVTHTTTLCEALGHRIRSYKEDHPNLSGTQIAKKFNMSTSSLNRIENGDVRVPNIDQVLKVLRGTGATGDLLKYLDANYPIIADTYRDLYSHNLKSQFVDLNFESFFEDRDTFLLSLLLVTKDHLTRKEIDFLFGIEGQNVINKLLKSKYVKEEGKKIYFINNEPLQMEQEALKKLMSLTIEKCYRADEINKGLNYLSFKSSSVDLEKTMPKVINILKEAHSKMRDVMNDSENTGEDCIFFGLVADSLIAKQDIPLGRLQ